MDVQNGTVPGPTISVACTQKLEWSSYWGPEITCTPDLSSIITNPTGITENTTNINSNNNNININNNNNNITTTNSSIINNIANLLLSSLSPETETFKCNLFRKNTTTHEAIFKCFRTGSENIKLLLNQTFEAINDCVYNTTIVIRSVLDPVSEIDLVLPKFLSITNNYTSTVANIYRNNIDDVDYLSTATNFTTNNKLLDDILQQPFVQQCTSNIYQLLNCSNLAINQSFFENEQSFYDNYNLVNLSTITPITTTTTTTSIFDQSIKCFLSVNNLLNAAALAVTDDDINNNNHRKHFFNFSVNGTIFSGVGGGGDDDDSRWQYDDKFFHQNHFTTNYPNYNDNNVGGDNVLNNIVAGSYDWTFLFVIIFIFAGGLGNILVCLAVALDRKLQNVTNYFLFSLAIADLLVSLFVMPLGAIPSFLGKFFLFVLLMLLCI